jgi:hypothetical protein
MTSLARALFLTTCWITAAYAFIASSPFAYLQFIKPRVFRWVGMLSDRHALVSWIGLASLLWLLRPHWSGATPRARAARMLGVLASLAAVYDTAMPVLPGLHDGAISVYVGVAALVPIIWLSIVDHLAAWPAVARLADVERGEAARLRHEGRVFAASLGTAVLLTAAYAVLASASVARAFEPDLLASGLALGVASSALGHLLVFSAVFVVLAVTRRLASGSLPREYGVLVLVGALLFAGLFARMVGDSLGLTGATGRIAALATGLSIMLAWGGARFAGHARRAERPTSGLDLLLSPPSNDRPGRALLTSCAAVLPLAWGFSSLAGQVDWDSVLLESGVVVVWILTFALMYRATQQRQVSTAIIFTVCAFPIAVHAAWRVTEFDEHVLDRYSVHNPSFLVADRLLRERTAGSPFDRFLRANTGLTDVAVKPVSIDLANASSNTATERPFIFLFVVDSLRSDYLSPYNPEVHFTPRIAEFASRNVFFPNAFTRYGGTGLSMPAIWAGSALAHKQYVVPFDSMNSLQKLLDGNGYQRIQTRDHITEALWTQRDDDVELDRGKNEMDFDFCTTLDELGRLLEQRGPESAPVFAQTRSLNLHVAAVRHGYVPPGKSYPGFEPPYAYRVERIDGCFGAFIDRLIRLRLYDKSVVVLTADHGELIGEDGRWGHSYHMFPQVIQVPLFVHLPASSTARFDTGAMTLSTDITPTLYSVLGYDRRAGGPLTGKSLSIRTPDDSAEQRRESVVLAASYGAVYAVVSVNGRSLYIADAIQEQDHTYRRTSLTDLKWTEVPVDPASRVLGQMRIRRHVDAVARTYGVDRPF